MARIRSVLVVALLACALQVSANANSEQDPWSSLVEMSATTRAADVDTTPGFRFMMTGVQQQLAAAMKATAEASDLSSFMRVRDFVGQILARVQLEQRLADIQAAQDVAVCQHNVRRQRRKVDNQASLTDTFNTSLTSTTMIINTFPALLTRIGNEITAQAQKIAVEKQRLDRLESERSAENFDFQSKRNHTRDMLAAVQQLLANLERIPLQLIVRKPVVNNTRPNIPSPISNPVVSVAANSTNATQTNSTAPQARFKSIDAADVFSMVDRLAADKLLDFDGSDELAHEAQAAELMLQNEEPGHRGGDGEVADLLFSEGDNSKEEGDDSPLFLELQTLLNQPAVVPVTQPTVVLDNTPLVVEARQLEELRKLYRLLLTLRSQLMRHLWFNKQAEKSNRLYYDVKRRDMSQMIFMLETFNNATIANRTVLQERLANATRIVGDARRGMEFNLPLLTIMRQQLEVYIKACNDTQNEITNQDRQRNQTMDTLRAIQTVLTERIDAILNPPKPAQANLTLAGMALNVGSSSSYSTCWELRVAGFALSGIYTLVDRERNNAQFQAFCDMRTDGGGWMLSFKQVNHASGGVAFDAGLFGAEPLLHTQFNASTTGSLIGYGKPKQMLYKSSIRGSWFITQALDVNYQYWRIEPTPRYCLFRKLHNQGDEWRLSPLWSSTLPMWDDANIQLMGVPHPDISAITIGRFTTVQQGPQCMEPNCAKERHGRFNGRCQNGSVGEGNWMIFTR